MNTDNEKLIWKEEHRKVVFTTPVFAVTERKCRGPDQREGIYSVLECRDWAIVIPLLKTPEGDRFVLVRQWRHGENCLSLEFPGGVFEPGEDELVAASRELNEETGYTPAKMRKLGEVNPNPAIMSNHVHFFLAEGLEAPGAQHLDDDEFVEVVTLPCEEVIAGMGKAPYCHALMYAALMLYMRDAR
jgi:8-oxo-dGTP pyrophosphatase MutT (NUDIX family)